MAVNLRLILRRLGWFVPIVLATAFICYLPTGVVYDTVEERGYQTIVSSPRFSLAAFWEGYSGYLSRLLRGDLGESIYLARPVTSIIAEAFPRSLLLLGTAVGIAALVGISLGLFGASKPGQRESIPLLLLASLGVSLPSFLLAILAQLFAARLTRLTGHRVLPIVGFGLDRHLIMPAIVTSLWPITYVARATSVAMSDIWRQDYIRTARAKGLRETYILYRHALKNAAIPIVAALARAFKFSVSTLVIVEYLFHWPGVAFHLLKAVLRRPSSLYTPAGRACGLIAIDAPLAVGLTLSLVFTLFILDLVVDLTIRQLDPRLRKEGRRA
ncbi:MAG: ABC transporter permease [Chloroflexota bacterium]|nr:ABC transporter permease [Chloroflexota bacterium]